MRPGVTYARVKGKGAVALAGGLVLSIAVGGAAVAYVTQNNLIYLDAGQASSFSSVSAAWQDLSTNNVDGTFTGSVVYDPATKSLLFPGGSNGTAYATLNTAGDPFKNFESGFSLEFEVDFGTLVNWEAVIDMAASVGGTGDVIYVGHFYGSSEMGVELYRAGVKEGLCHTSTGSNGNMEGNFGTAIVPGAFAKWVVTIGNEAGTVKCRIYKDGVELPTRVSISGNGRNTTVDAYGTPFVLPSNASRPSAFIGRSNFTANRDFEGRFRYIRAYSDVLTSSEVAENAGLQTNNSSNGSNLTEPASTPVKPPTLAETGPDLSLVLVGSGVSALLLVMGVAATLSSRRKLAAS